MPDVAASTAIADKLAIEREHCIEQLAAATREATRALAALDFEALERCTAVQKELCIQLAAVNAELSSRVEPQPASPSAVRELSGSLRTYTSLLRRSSQWVETNQRTLQLITGFPEQSALGQGLRY